MKTLLGTKIPENILGVFYVCNYVADHMDPTIDVAAEVLFEDPGAALNAFAETPNPESQLATGATHDLMLRELEMLHKRMSDPIWLEELADYI
jgi:hypothetical protein